MDQNFISTSFSSRSNNFTAVLRQEEWLLEISEYIDDINKILMRESEIELPALI